MPEYAMWALIVCLVGLALGLALKVAQLEHRLKASEDEPSRLRSELEMLKEKHYKEISDIKELNQGEMEKIIEESKKTIHDPIDLTKPKNFISDYDPYENL